MKRILLSLSIAGLCQAAYAQPQTWIVGGQSAQQGQFPWMTDYRVQGGHLCGAALIHPSWVITAAHCADPTTTDTSDVRMRFNSINTNGALNPSGGVERKVKQFFVHPEFSGDLGKGYDIALAWLRDPVTTITPIGLPAVGDTATIYQTGAPVRIAGWGLQDTFSMTSPAILKWCATKVYDFNICNNLFGALSKRVFCAGYKGTEAQNGAAAGDSGGPVWTDAFGSPRIIGIVSGGVGPTTTADTPGLFTKVALYRKWIDSVINANTPVSAGFTPWGDQDIRVTAQQNDIQLQFGNIAASRVRAELYLSDGRKVYSTGILNPAFRSYTLPVGNLPQGMYILRIFDEQGDGYFVKKMVRNG